MYKTPVITVVLSLLLCTACAWAGDSVTIQIGCTIPAIPGVNVPPYPAKPVAPQTVSGQQKELTSPPQKTQTTTYIATEQEIQSEGKKAQVQTIYSR